MDVSKPYSEVIPIPTLKKNMKEEIMMEEDSEFFKKYINVSSSSVSTLTINESSVEEGSNSSTSKAKPNEATNFFMKLLNSSSNEDKKTVEAQNSLLKHTKKQINMSK